MASTDPVSRFDDGVAFVAGGSGGIGAAITRAPGRARARTSCSPTTGTAPRRTSSSRSSRPGTAAWRSCQLALEDVAAVAATIADVRARTGRIHSVVYAAGPVTPINFVGSLTDEEWTRTFAHDTHACFHLVHAALPILKEQKGGSITAVTTTQFSRHVPMSVLSSAPKAAIESMLQVVAREYGRYGVRANSVRSGWLDGGKFADGIGGQVSDKARQAIVASIPLGALGDPRTWPTPSCSCPRARPATSRARHCRSTAGWKL